MRLGSKPVPNALTVSFLVLAPALIAQTPRTPRGIYAVVKVEDNVSQQQAANPSITTAQLDAYFNTFYQGLLQDPAVAGLGLQVHWDTLNPNPPGAANSYFWAAACTICNSSIAICSATIHSLQAGLSIISIWDMSMSTPCHRATRCICGT